MIEYDEELEMKKQKMRAQQFEEEYKNKGRKKKPMKKRVFGPMWTADNEATGTQFSRTNFGFKF